MSLIFILQCLPGPIDPCGSQTPLIIDGSLGGYISTPNYPEDYPSNSDCQWEIHANEGEAVTLTFIDFDTERR